MLIAQGGLHDLILHLVSLPYCLRLLTSTGHANAEYLLLDSNTVASVYQTLSSMRTNMGIIVSPTQLSARMHVTNTTPYSDLMSTGPKFRRRSFGWRCLKAVRLSRPFLARQLISLTEHGSTNDTPPGEGAPHHHPNKVRETFSYC